MIMFLHSFQEETVLAFILTAPIFHLYITPCILNILGIT